MNLYDALIATRYTTRAYQDELAERVEDTEPIRAAYIGRAIEALEQADDAAFNALNVLSSFLNDERAGQEILDFDHHPQEAA